MNEVDQAADDRAGARKARWLPALASMLLPSVCALCGGLAAGPVCAACQAHYLTRSGPRCRRCANPVEAADAAVPCGACQADPPAYDATVAATDYAAPLDGLVLQLKFGGVLALAPWCADAIRRAVTARPGWNAPELLCPVPISAARLVERGFNQALEIARPLSRRLNVPLHARLAVRTRDTRAQSSVAPGERQQNMRNAFTIAPEGLPVLRGKHIGVVDDVMTSGHTLNELARTLKRFGAARVSNLVFARTPPH